MLSLCLKFVPLLLLACFMPVTVAHAQQCSRQCKNGERRNARGCCISTDTQPKKPTPPKNSKRPPQRGRPPQPDRPPPQTGPNTPTSHGDSSSQGPPPNSNREHPGTLDTSAEGAKSIARQAEPAPRLQEPNHGGKASGEATQPQGQQATATLTESGEATQPQKPQTTPTTTELATRPQGQQATITLTESGEATQPQKQQTTPTTAEPREATQPQGQQATTTLTKSGETVRPQKQQTTPTTTEPREATQPQGQQATTTAIEAKGQARDGESPPMARLTPQTLASPHVRTPAVQASRPIEQQGIRTRNYGATTAFVDVIVAALTLAPSVSNDNYLWLGLGYTFSGQLTHTMHGNFGTGWLSSLNRAALPYIFALIGYSLLECNDDTPDCDTQERRGFIGGAVIGTATALSLDWFVLSRDRVKARAESNSAFLPTLSSTHGGWVAGLAIHF
jgi:hypothetical protein